ncbi:MAG: NUDIX domain-containing protein [Candidatus Dadabacteria bacterium]|nr:MAG: NUDIX domain-containing protein [Candidatus Dadabacteria bacterium]
MKFLPRVALLLAKLYWFITRPITVGVQAIVLDDKGRVLLVRHTYRKGWFLPGGALKRGESVEQAVKRELFEETGIISEEKPQIVPKIRYTRWDFKHNHTVAFFISKWRQSDEVSDFSTSWEIAEAKFFPLDSLPSDTHTSVLERLKEVKFLRKESNS